MRALRPLGEMKFRVGVEGLFQWVAPVPITGVPELSVALDTPVTLNLTAVHAPLTVVSVAPDRRKLTIVAPTGTAGLQGRYGDGWLVTSTDSCFPVRVSRIDDTSCYLADILPRDVAIDSITTASLQFSTYTGALTTVDVTGTKAQNVSWTVSYDSDFGTDAPNPSDLREMGVMHVVPQAFDTGLTHNMVVSFASTLGDEVPRQQNSWMPQIQESFDELILWVREQLGPNYTEDNIPASGLFRPAHLSLCKAIIFDSIDSDISDRYRNQAFARLRQAMSNYWKDLNGDAVIDEGETGNQTMGAKATDVRYGYINPPGCSNNSALPSSNGCGGYYR